MRVALFLLLAGCDIVFGLERPAPDAPPPPPEGRWLSATEGSVHACAIRVDNTLWCWGDNFFGETGLGDFTAAGFEVTAPRQVGQMEWREVHGGAAHTCGLTTDGALWCWGYNGMGELGDATHANKGMPVRIGDKTWRTVATGDFFTCGVRDDQSLWCWGDNSFGEVGDGTMGQRAEPTLVDSTHAWRAVAGGVGHACAITDAGDMYCWGTGPLAPLTISTKPVQVQLGHAWTAVAAGSNVTCGVSDGHVLCFGANGNGVLGDGTFANHDDARTIGSDRTDFVDVSVRSGSACARAADGTVACWGDNRRGQLGTDTAQPLQSSPVALAPAWRNISVGANGACGVSDHGDLYCTGDNGTGQVGDGSGGSVLAPQRLDGTWTGIWAGPRHVCGGRAGKLWCWGDNPFGELADTTTNSRQTPVETAFLPSLIGLGEYGTCGVGASSQLSCWGLNNEHQIVGSQAVYAAVPVLNTGVAGPVKGVASFEHTCAIDKDSHALCWGRNSDGQLGRNTISASEAAPQVVLDTANGAPLFLSVTAGVAHTCGIAAGNSVVTCWGRGADGQLGIANGGAGSLRAASVIVGSKVDAGGYHTCAIITSNMLACWGRNDSGQVGDGTTANKMTPVAVTDAGLTGTAWIDVSAGQTHTCGLRNDQSLWCWGNNTRGALGLADTVSRTVPAKVGTSKWLQIGTGDGYTCGLQADGTLWCWGLRGLGALGDNRAWVTQFVQIGAQ